EGGGGAIRPAGAADRAIYGPARPRRRPPRKYLRLGGEYRATRAEVSPDRPPELGAKAGGFAVGGSLRRPIHAYISPVISHADLGFTAVRWLVPTARSRGAHGSAAAQPENKNMALPDFSMRQLLEAGVHFGHQSHRWNPTMSAYIFATRNNIHIIDLTLSVPMLHRALQAISDTVAEGGRILFVGTKRQAQDAIAEAAKRSAQYYVNSRWLGGTLTNWKTVSN